jgi:hypothetical protein
MARRAFRVERVETGAASHVGKSGTQDVVGISGGGDRVAGEHPIAFVGQRHLAAAMLGAVSFTLSMKADNSASALRLIGTKRPLMIGHRGP